MAWATPRTWVAAETVTAEHWRGVFSQLRANGPALVTTAEDLLSGSGVSGSPLLRLPVGSNGQALQMGAAAAEWASAPVGCQVDVTALTDTTSSSATQWGTEEAEITPPGGVVDAVAILTGQMATAPDGTYDLVTVSVDISFDSGSTWDSYSASVAVAAGGGRSVTWAHRRTGTPTGTVQARVSLSSVAYTLVMEDGQLMLMVFGA